MFKTATVRFNNDYEYSKEYAYYTTMDNLEKGDLVVVEARDWYQVATFERYKQSDKATKHIVTRVDTDKMEKEKEAVQEAMDLKEQIEIRAREVEEMNRLKEVAKSDNKLKELVEQLEKLECNL